jgi:hypothetical protein
VIKSIQNHQTILIFEPQISLTFHPQPPKGGLKSNLLFYKFDYSLFKLNHLEKEVIEYDDGRTHDIEKLGVRILRFTNDQVFNYNDKVLQEILKAMYS